MNIGRAWPWVGSAVVAVAVLAVAWVLAYAIAAGLAWVAT